MTLEEALKAADHKSCDVYVGEAFKQLRDEY